MNPLAAHQLLRPLHHQIAYALSHAGMKRDFMALERRRLEAAKLLARGFPEAEVAQRVGVHRQSVNRWANN